MPGRLASVHAFVKMHVGVNANAVCGHDLHMFETKERFSRRAVFWRGLVLTLVVGWLITCSVRGNAQDAPDAGAPVDEGLRAPELLEPVTPEYPAGETTASRVELELTLDATGAVTASDVATTGGAAFDAAALAAVPQLRFSPALRGGRPIPAQIRFAFQFEPPPPAAPPAPEPAPPPPPPPAVAPAQEVIGSVDLEIRGAPPLRETTRHTLDTQEVRTIPGTNGDVLRSVETMPGVARPAYGQGILIVRGSAPEDSQVFVDGTAIPYAYHVGDSSSVIPGDMLDRLDFYPGNFGPEFGRGMGGVVDVGLRSPRRDRFGGLIQVDAIDGRLMIETPLGEHTGLMIGMRRSWVDAWIGSVLEGFDASLTAAPVYYDAQAILEHDLSSKTRLRLSVFGADDRLKIVVKSPDPQDPAFSGEFGGYTRFLRAQLRLDSELAPSTRWVNTVSWGITDSDQAFGSNGFAQTAHDFTLRSDLRADLSRAITFNAGIDAFALIDDIRATFRPYPASNAPPSPYFARPSRSASTTANLVRPAVYAGFELRPFDGFKLMPSVRVDYTHDTEQVTVDPRLGVRWDVVRAPRRTTLKAGAGVYHQPPAIEQSNSLVGTDGVQNNRAIHLSLGIEQELAPGFEVSIEGFYKRLDNLVVARSDETRLIGARFENTGEGRVLGAETLLKYKPEGGRFFGWIAYTLSRSERRDVATEQYRTFSYDQTHILSAVGNLGLGRGWTLGARFRFISGMPYTPYLGGVVDLDAGAYAPIESARLYSARLDAFHQLDLRIEKLWDFVAWKLTAYLELRNVYNHANSEGVAYSYDYSKRDTASGIPILPVLGVRGEL
ncbi:MAG TPA: TonB-dependent receptor [Polyangiales bacterium]|nr:TonB-dependent receptor [Polyangiales bacterium]